MRGQLKPQDKSNEINPSNENKHQEKSIELNEFAYKTLAEDSSQNITVIDYGVLNQQNQTNNNNCHKQHPSEQEQTSCQKWMGVLFGVIPMVLMVGMLVAVGLSDDLKQRVTNTFASFHGQLSFEIIISLLLFGALLVALSFPYVIFEMSLGFTFPFIPAILIAVFAKLIGEAVCFCIARYLMKDCFLSFLKYNGVFQFLQKASFRHPSTVSHLLRSSFLIPLVIINFGCGILHITFVQFIMPALIWGFFYSAFSVLAGSQFVNISQVIENASYPTNSLLFIFELSMLIASVVVGILALMKASQVYKQLQEEVEYEDVDESEVNAPSTTESIHNNNNSHPLALSNHQLYYSTQLAEKV